jgi:hypothetical protein
MMLARLICFLLGHTLDEHIVYEGGRPLFLVKRGECPRCKAAVFVMRDARD